MKNPLYMLLLWIAFALPLKAEEVVLREANAMSDEAIQGSHTGSRRFARETDFDQFGALPVLHEGRIKPLSHFAYIALQHTHGASSFEDRSATAWLATTLFAPEQMAEKPLFPIRNDEVARSFGLEPNKAKRYSFQEVYPALTEKKAMVQALRQKDRNTLSAREAAVVRLHDRAALMLQLTEALSAIRPLEVSPRAREMLIKYEIPVGAREVITYLDMQPYRRDLEEALKAIYAARHHDESDGMYTDDDLAMGEFSYYLEVLATVSEYNETLRILPLSEEPSAEWVTPWQLIRSGNGTPKTTALMEQWQAMARAFHAQDAVQFDAAVAKAAALYAPYVEDQPLALEQLYHAVSWKWVAIGGYVLSLLCVALSWRLGAVSLAAIALTSHSFGLAMRILILERPPVTTLYESVLFVGWVAALLGFLWVLRSKHTEILAVGAGIAALLLFISPLYVEGDSLEMLVAVLNTNIWLATHVIIITMGYGASMVAGTLAHVALWKRGYRLQVIEETKILKPETYDLKPVFLITLIAALLTIVGTVLGGIWADQSWGRFWGWDPKENGALLIVLWIVWLLHARITKQLPEIGWLAFLAGLNIIVAISWFGVNLLGVGLHSYGFTESAVYGLIAFCLCELLVISFLTLRAIQQSKQQH